MRRLRRFLPLVLLLAAIVAAWAGGLTEHLSWAGLASHQTALRDWVGQHRAAAAALYLAVYTAAIALSLPQGAVLTLVGGLLFGAMLGGVLALIGATDGGVLLFLIARSAAGDALAERGGAFLGKLRARLQRDGFLYLLAVRLVPLFPFWLVNLGAALSGIGLLPYTVASLIGMAPVTFILASIGAGIGDMLAAGEQPDLSVLFSLPILGPLIALALLSLVPLLWRRKAPDA
jgi:uncharacterized membrane protein YdjX (TVP38/TMEM64 family)